ncbi:MAG: LuxR family transcriptional regulator [Phycisphaerales bacterium]
MQEFYAAMRIADDPDILWDAFVTFFETRGITRLCVIHAPPAGVSAGGARTVRTKGYPEEWTRRYIGDELYKRDPIPLHARNHPTPFRWSDIGKMRKLEPDEQSVLDEFRQLDTGDGIAIPVFGPRGRNGYIGIALGTEIAAIGEEDLREFQIVAQIAYQRYCELLAADDCEDISLSRRETEILEWVARGKSNSSIAKILGISGNTVDTHLRRIYDKLGVSDRTTAAIRGIGCGLINP